MEDRVDHKNVNYKSVKNNLGSGFVKSILYSINLFTNVILVLTVVVCFLYAYQFPLGAYQLHIILCVLGYQIFMCLGILTLSKYNIWSIYIKLKYRRHLHWILQVIGVVLAFVGSFYLMKEKRVHFGTAHGVLALCALIMSSLSVLNGVLVMNMNRINSFVNIFWIKLIHYVTGVATLFCAAASLCLGFDKLSFRNWMNNDAYVSILMVLTCLFTVIVSIDFWLHTRIKFIYNK